MERRVEDAFEDLRGTVCPMNFVKVKVALAELAKDQVLRVYLDDGEPISNVPRSVTLQGHDVLATERKGDYWSVTIKKG